MYATNTCAVCPEFRNLDLMLKMDDIFILIAHLELKLEEAINHFEFEATKDLL